MSPIDSTFTHLYRTLGTAVHYLMVPVEDQVDAIASAFLVIDVSCRLAPINRLSEDAQGWFQRLGETMGTDLMTARPLSAAGPLQARVQEMSDEQLAEFTECVWELYRYVASNY